MLRVIIYNKILVKMTKNGICLKEPICQGVAESFS